MFTLGSAEMIKAMTDELSGHYNMSLNPEDMRTVIYALATSVGFVGWEDMQADDDLTDRAMSLFSSIAETLEIEGI